MNASISQSHRTHHCTIMCEKANEEFAATYALLATMVGTLAMRTLRTLMAFPWKAGRNALNEVTKPNIVTRLRKDDGSL